MSLGVVVVQLSTISGLRCCLLIFIFILFSCSAAKKFQNPSNWVAPTGTHTCEKLSRAWTPLGLFVLLLRDNELWNNSHLKKEKINGFEFAFLFLLAPLCSFFLLPLSPACLLLKEAEKTRRKKKIISRHSQYLSFCAFSSSSRS